MDKQQKEKFILLKNISTQLDHLVLRFDKLYEEVLTIKNRVDNIDKRLPHRKQGYFGGYWETIEDAEEHTQ